MSYNYISTSVATNVKAQSAKLNKIIISSMPASSTIDIYDHASANTNPIFSLVAADIKTHEIQFDTSMQNGIRVVTAGVTPVKMLVIFDELI